MQSLLTASLESWAWPSSILDVTLPAPSSVTPDQLLTAFTCYNILLISPFSKLTWCSSSRIWWQLPTAATQARSITNHVQRSDKVWCEHTYIWLKLLGDFDWTNLRKGFFISMVEKKSQAYTCGEKQESRNSYKGMSWSCKTKVKCLKKCCIILPNLIFSKEF